jgi:hypothetical protein
MRLIRADQIQHMEIQRWGYERGRQSRLYAANYCRW